MGKPLAQTHRALDDVLALVEIFQKELLWQVV
jgi:DNA polymerase III epsilon subunit-like protein